MEFVKAWILELWTILVDSGLWLLVGFLLAGVIHAFVPTKSMRRHLGGGGVISVIKASVIGIPLPLCSCSVIPAAAGLRRHGASKGASAAFAVSTPEADAPSVALTWALMGPVMALARPLAALGTALVAGVLIDATDRDRPVAEDEQPIADEPADSGGGCSKGCGCAPKSVKPGRLGQTLRFGLVDLPADLGGWLAGGLILSAAIGAATPAGWLEAHLGGGIVPMLLALVIGVPLYICATASTPLAAVLIAKGLSPGAALVLLLAGPATNMATMGWVIKDLGIRALLIYLVTIGAGALAAGIAFDAFVPLEFVVVSAADEAHAHGKLGEVAGAAVGLLIGIGVVRQAIAWTKNRKKNGACGCS